MKIKSLITVAIIAPLLAFNLTAKAGTCPASEEFEQRTNASGKIDFIDQDGDFALAEKPIAFAGATFMNPSEPVKGVRYGKISACLYLIKDASTKNPTFKSLALVQNLKTKVATIAADSEAWKKHTDTKGRERDNRYDCESDDVEDCQFNLYYLKK
ncbi:hypothetical protein RVIR1_09860 [Candidatus Rickettsiella viridis]|uniref:DUF3757 domain-containing protein n=1 Tax=Candidatus Rickettsiella viridis TaxID=676208 RepID=A0A2Z5UV66_9COXI|nr:hypothetical protein [Candidatus Rickettsiella viridis]BBB15459.1 hypothetical protein RVIR1_09860 [Candidatus Rickettsiella viridis]